MAIKLDTLKVTEVINEVNTGFSNMTIQKLQLDMGKNTIKIAQSLPENMNQLAIFFENVQTFGKQMATNLEACKNQVIEMENDINQSMKNEFI